MGGHRILLALACLAAISCSTAPKKSDTVNDVKDLAAEATSSGNAYYRQGRYDLALRFFSLALDYNTSVDNEVGIIQSYNSIGQVYMAGGMGELAEEIFLKALTLSKDAGEEMVFVSSKNLGELYLQKGEPERALAVFSGVAALPQKALKPWQAAILYHNLGTTHKALGDLAIALEILRKSLAINLENKLFEEAAANYYMLASVYSKQGDYGNAMINAELALSYDKKIENSLGIAKDLYALGLISARKGAADAAYEYFQRSYLVYTTLSMTKEMKKALVELIPIAEGLGKAREVEAFRKDLADLEKK